MKIRTLTYGVTRAWATLAEGLGDIARAGAVLRAAKAHYEAAGFEVQTTRLSLPPFLGELSRADRVSWLRELGSACAAEKLEFVSLGAYAAGELTTAEIVAAIATYSPFNLTTKIADGRQTLAAGVRQAGEVIRALAEATPDGLCNFRYAAIANCPPGIPFFPASYQEISPTGQPTLSLGLQMPDLIYEVITASREAIQAEGPAALSQPLTVALVARLEPVQKLAVEFCADHALLYTGIDLSPAPLGEDSIVRAFEAAGLGRFGEPGTLALAAAITHGLQAANGPLKTTGYNGLMLPPLEDRWLGERAAQGLVDVQKLLTYSAVCGMGLDVIPLPGHVDPLRLENLLYDLAALSARYQKPLSARLFPVPGMRAGEFTAFDSIYLTNTVVMEL